MVTAKIITATKEIVDALLSQNINNRTMRRSIVETYARSIHDGHWEITNQGIGVSVTGELIDGQHRLAAIAMCGYPPVKLLVVYGLSENAKICIDTHAKRDARDIIGFLENKRLSRETPGICRAISRHINPGSHVPTIHEIMDVLNAYRDEIEAIISAPENCNFYACANLAGFAIVAKNRMAIKDVCSFMGIVEKGEMLTRKMPAFHLRNSVLNMRGQGGGGATISERIEKTIKATEAFLDCKEMGVLRID